MGYNLSGNFLNVTRNNSDGYSFEHARYSQQALYYGIAVYAVNLILCFTAIFGNLAVLLTIWKSTALHSSANILLANLAVSDLAVGCIGQPLLIAFLLSRSADVALTFFILSSFFCGVTFLTITAIGLDRLLALQLHLRYESLVTPPRVRLLIIFIWLLSAFFPSMLVWNSDLFYISISPAIWTLVVGNFLVYLKIYLFVRHHQKQIQHHQQVASNGNIFSIKRLKKSALNTFLVFILLVCCYLPYSLVTKLLLAGVKIPELISYTTSVTLFFANSSLNPLLYCWRVREIRTAMKQRFFFRF